MNTLVDFLNHNNLSKALRMKKDNIDYSKSERRYFSSKIKVIDPAFKENYDFDKQLFCGYSEYRHYMALNGSFNNIVYLVADEILIGQVKIGLSFLEETSFVSFNNVSTNSANLEFGSFYEIENPVKNQVLDIWRESNGGIKILRLDNINLNWKRDSKEEFFFLTQGISLRQSIRNRRDYLENKI